MHCFWKFGLSLFVLASIVYSVTAISCYMCNSRSDADCDVNPGNPNYDYLKDCKELKDGTEFDRCRKINQWVDFEVDGLKPGKRVIRYCGKNQTNEKDDRAWYYRAGFGGRQEVHTCRQDKCNGASHVSLTTFTLISTVCVCIYNIFINSH